MPHTHPRNLLPRGVYELPVISPNGSHCAVAVNSAGEYLGWLHYTDDGERVAARALWQMLDEHDPEKPLLRAG